MPSLNDYKDDTHNIHIYYSSLLSIDRRNSISASYLYQKPQMAVPNNKTEEVTLPTEAPRCRRCGMCLAGQFVDGLRYVQGNQIRNTCRFNIFMLSVISHFSVQSYLKYGAREQIHGVLRNKQHNGKAKEYMVLQYGKSKLG